MNVLVVGGGGREHALVWALRRTAAVWCAPGNPGTAALATNLPLDITDHAAVAHAADAHRIDLVVIGPEAPLAAGLADHLAGRGHAVFGPSAKAAQIEASKAFAKDVMRAAGVPTATSRTFTTEVDARAYLANHPEPLVVKASGLAAGKGAMVCDSRAEAFAAAREMFGGRFGDAGHEIVVEQFLSGEELSVFAITDGEHVMLLPAAQDHKRLGEGDAGPNTGGMGAYTPVSIASTELLSRVEREILIPTLRELANRGAPYRGVLYAGLMITPSGDPMVIEFNCRLGDPEAQVVLPAADIDLLEHLLPIARGDPWRPERHVSADRAAVTTVVAAPGYPERPRKGAAITLPDPLPHHTLLFHAGTARDSAGVLRAAGGRVLNAVGLGRDIPEAAARSRALAQAIGFEGKVFRRDIAWREVTRAGAA